MVNTENGKHRKALAFREPFEVYAELLQNNGAMDGSTAIASAPYNQLPNVKV
jgi:hypothetical protein